MHKLSFYNFYIPVEEDKVFLVYNSFQNSLFEIDYLLGNALSKKDAGIINLQDIPIKYKKDLINEGFIVDAFKNEQEIVCRMKRKILTNVREWSNSVGLVLLTTNNCNLNCSYCFEGKEKPKTKMDEETFQRIVKFIELKKKEEKILNLSICWYGGEPLLYPNLLKDYGQRLKKICENLDIQMSSSIITNGIGLSNKNIKILQEIDIEMIQVTIDGEKEIHDRRRPFVNSNKSSFDQIIKNLEDVAGKIRISIRINVDKEVYPGIQKLFEELIIRKIWPHNKNISLYLGFTCATKEFNNETLFSDEEFYSAVVEFRKLKFQIYNDWAAKNDLPSAKLKCQYPRFTNNYCGTYSGSNAFVIDSEGYISKCWEHVNNPQVVIGNIQDGIINTTKSEKFKKIIENLNIPQKCLNCKILPICEAQFCPNDNFELIPNHCSFWKYQMLNSFKEQYLMQKQHPNMIESFDIVNERCNTENFMGFEI